MARCAACSTEVLEGNRFCGSCGSRVGSSDSDVTLTSFEPAARPISDPKGGGRYVPGAMVAGRYRIHGILGRGGMGEVYRADDLKLGQPVALKFLPASLERDAGRLSRFLDEVRVARQVSHPNVCRVYDVGEVAGNHFLSMEYVDGEDLASLLRRIGRLPEDKALQIARQVCAGLAAAHDRGVLHRDLKPANVMIDGRGAARITDFGLAGAAEAFVGARAREGTPGYMAPEQLAAKEATVRSDLYALGLLLYELFTGKRAFEASSFADIARLQEASQVTPPSSLVESLHPAVERAILHCLETDPADRPPSALSVAAALPGGNALAAALAAGDTPSPEMVAASVDAEATRPSLALGLAVGAVALFLLAAWIGGRTSLRAFVPLDKPPAAMVDRAREVMAKLGYTEPVYAEPVDSAFGYNVAAGRLATIERSDASASRWAVLKNPGADVVSFWYRQSPTAMWPSPASRSFAGAQVETWDPFPRPTASTTVTLDLAGRLRLFACAPRRFRPDGPPAAPPDWSRAFELAGLDIATFERVEPGYQRFMNVEHRAAWTGVLPDRPQPIRVEAGWNEGRLALFALLDDANLADLAAEPESLLQRRSWDEVLSILVLLFVGAGVLARRNVKAGRADRRGAMRFAALVFGLTFIFESLRSHPLYSWNFAEALFPISATALFYAGMMLMLYYAIEPYGRRVSPAMLVSWSRLVGRPTMGWNDPLVGYAVLIGCLAGAALSWLRPIEHGVLSWLAGAPARPAIGVWSLLLGSRQALAEVLGTSIAGITSGLILAFSVVAAKLLLRSLRLAVPAAALVWIALGGLPAENTGATLVWLAVQLAGAAGLLAVLLTHGLIAVIVANAVLYLNELACASDWTVWHGQPALLALAAAAGLVVYGYRTATGGRGFADAGS